MAYNKSSHSTTNKSAARASRCLAGVECLRRYVKNTNSDALQMREKLKEYTDRLESMHVSPEGTFVHEVEHLEIDCSVNQALRSKLLQMKRKEKHIPKLELVNKSELLSLLERIIQTATESLDCRRLAEEYFGISTEGINPVEYHAYYNDEEPEHALFIVICSESVRRMINVFLSYD